MTLCFACEFMEDLNVRFDVLALLNAAGSCCTVISYPHKDKLGS